MRHFYFWSLAVAAAIAGACFSERVGSTDNVTPGANCNVPLSVVDSGHVIVAIHNFTFQPDSVAVKPGGTVTWVNCEPVGTEPHTATANGGEWDSSDVGVGERFSHTFTASTGTSIPYYCKPHTFMVGKVVVQ
jgi:plastocyanin